MTSQRRRPEALRHVWYAGLFYAALLAIVTVAALVELDVDPLSAILFGAIGPLATLVFSRGVLNRSIASALVLLLMAAVGIWTGISELLTMPEGAGIFPYIVAVALVTAGSVLFALVIRAIVAIRREGGRSFSLKR